MAFRKKVTAKSLRARLEHLVESGDEESGTSGTTTNPNLSNSSNAASSGQVAASAGPLSAVASTSSLLSFRDEEEAEVFVVKKKKRKLKQPGRKRGGDVEDDGRSSCDIIQGSLPAAAVPTSSNVESINKGLTNGTEASAPAGGGRTASPDSSTTVSAAEKVRVVEADSTSSIVTGEEAERMSSSGAVGVKTEQPHEPDDELRRILSSGSIPDAKTIHMARKRRQFARESGIDFIPLEEQQRSDTTTAAGRRAARENDDEDDAEHSDEEIKMTAKNPKEESRKIAERQDFLDLEHGSDQEQDEIFEEWEREQLEKAVTKQQISSLQKEQSRLHGGRSAQPVDYDESSQPGLLRPTPYGVAAIPPGIPYFDMATGAYMTAPGTSCDASTSGLNAVAAAVPTGHPMFGGGVNTAIPMSFADVKKQLTNCLEERHGVSSEHTQKRDQATDTMIENHDAITKLEESMPDLTDRYRFFKEMQDYILDLLDCWNEKVPKLEAYEATMQRLWRERRDYLVKRRRLDVQDQYQECSAIALGKLAELNQKSDRKIRVAEREARRNRRRQKRRNAATSHEDGLSSDDEEVPSRIQNFNSTQAKAEDDAAALFADVDDDFSTIPAVNEKLEQWMNVYGESFAQAYISACMPKLYGPLVRRDIMTWNPLLPNCVNLKSCRWYKELLMFNATSMVQDAKDDQAASSEKTVEQFQDDARYNLIPSVIEKVVCPKLKGIVEDCWDPVSTSQSQRLTLLLKEWVSRYPSLVSNSKSWRALFETIISRLKDSLDDDLFIPLYPKSVVENKASGANAFIDRQFWSCVKILRNVVLFNGILSDKIVWDMALDGVLNRYIVLGLQTAISDGPLAITKAYTVVKALPVSLEHARSQLEPLCKWLCRWAEEIFHSHQETKVVDRDTARESIKQIQKLLVSLKCTDLALSLADRCRFTS